MSTKENMNRFKWADNGGYWKTQLFLSKDICFGMEYKESYLV